MSTKKVPVLFQDRVLVSRVKPESISAGGIYIPETALKQKDEGIVVAVGPKVGQGVEETGEPYSRPNVGDHVRFGEYAGIEVTVDGDEYLLMREADILFKF